MKANKTKSLLGKKQTAKKPTSLNATMKRTEKLLGIDIHSMATLGQQLKRTFQRHKGRILEYCTKAQGMPEKRVSTKSTFPTSFLFFVLQYSNTSTPYTLRMRYRPSLSL